VHYCAETFPNDNSLSSLIMKALKRTMAGEYSRELGEKVLAGQRRLASLGFKQGGSAGYGLQRILVSPDRKPKQPLALGERKSIATDRVILAPGSRNEIECVREIYRLLVEEHRTVHWIAQDLNRRRVPHPTSQWNYLDVHRILTHPKYMGYLAYGMCTSRLHTPRLSVPQKEWTIVPKAFKAIIDETTFAEAQRILKARTISQTDETLLNSLRELLKRRKRLSASEIDRAPGVASPTTFRKRFGSLIRAYELIGYGKPSDYSSCDQRQRTRALRDQLLARLVDLFPADLTIVRLGQRYRPRLEFRDHTQVVVLVCRACRLCKNDLRWIADATPNDYGLLALIARFAPGNAEYMDFHLLPSLDHRGKFQLSRKDPRLRRAIRLKSDLRGFLNAAAAFREAADNLS
jgi:hypothetical protein